MTETVDTLSCLENFFSGEVTKNRTSRIRLSKKLDVAVSSFAYSPVVCSKAEKLGTQTQIDNLRRSVFSTSAFMGHPKEKLRLPGEDKVSTSLRGCFKVFPSFPSEELSTKSKHSAISVFASRPPRQLEKGKLFQPSNGFNDPKLPRTTGKTTTLPPYMQQNCTTVELRRCFSKCYDSRELPVRVIPQSPFNRLGWIIPSVENEGHHTTSAIFSSDSGSTVIQSRQLLEFGGLPESYSQLLFVFVQGICSTPEFPYRFIAIQGCSDLISYLPNQCFTASFLISIARVFKAQIETSKPVKVRGVSLQLLLLLTKRMPFERIGITDLLLFLRTLLPQLGRSIGDNHSVAWQPEADFRNMTADGKTAASCSSTAVPRGGIQVAQNVPMKRGVHYNQHQIDIVGTSVQRTSIQRSWGNSYCPNPVAPMPRISTSVKQRSPKMGQSKERLTFRHSGSAESDSTTIGSLATQFLDQVFSRHSRSSTNMIGELVRYYIPAYQIPT